MAKHLRAMGSLFTCNIQRPSSRSRKHIRHSLHRRRFLPTSQLSLELQRPLSLSLDQQLTHNYPDSQQTRRTYNHHHPQIRVVRILCNKVKQCSRTPLLHRHRYISITGYLLMNQKACRKRQQAEASRFPHTQDPTSPKAITKSRLENERRRAVIILMRHLQQVRCTPHHPSAPPPRPRAEAATLDLEAPLLHGTPRTDPTVDGKRNIRPN